MALNKSFYTSSKKKHAANIKFIQDVMDVNGIAGGKKDITSSNILKSYIKLSKKISEKSIDQISREEVNQFIHSSLKLKERFEKHYPRFDEADDLISNALVKIEERETMALDASTLGKSKMRHESNLEIIRELRSKLEE